MVTARKLEFSAKDPVIIKTGAGTRMAIVFDGPIWEHGPEKIRIRMPRSWLGSKRLLTRMRVMVNLSGGVPTWATIRTMEAQGLIQVNL